MYIYRENVKEDIRNYIEEMLEAGQYELKDFINATDNDDLYNDIYEELWVADSVTGNGSGSYTFSTWEAEENICHNLDLLAEAVEEFGGSMDVLKDGAEACDVTIRCYLLDECLWSVLGDLEEEAQEEATEA